MCPLTSGWPICTATSVSGGLFGERSIWSLEPVKRFIAPETLYQQLIESVGSRISWGVDCDFKTGVIINTAPLPVVLSALGKGLDGVEFKRESITVKRFRVPRCDVYQTVYFPTSTHSMYRASITGDLLICEFAGEIVGDWQDDLEKAFSLPSSYTELDETTQRYGKIAPIDAAQRKQIIYLLTRDHGIYSIGRFATWRNILLDDVVSDAIAVKSLMTASAHDLQLIAMKGK